MACCTELNFPLTLLVTPCLLDFRTEVVELKSSLGKGFKSILQGKSSS